jgi:hypothetical protein
MPLIVGVLLILIMLRMVWKLMMKVGYFLCQPFWFKCIVLICLFKLQGDFRLCFPELKKMSSDPSYNINISGDIKQMLAELGTEKGRQIALHGGGGSKAQNERAAALVAILAARSRIKEDPQSTSNKLPRAYSIVDAASASVHGRSAAAAKAAPDDKTAARIAMHMAGERAPVNSTMVSFSQVQAFCKTQDQTLEKFLCYYTLLK